MTLTLVEEQVLLAIYDHITEQSSRGIATPEPPSVRELMPMTGKKSTSTISYHVSKLREKGLLAPQERIHGRTTRLTVEGYETADSLS